MTLNWSHYLTSNVWVNQNINQPYEQWYNRGYNWNWGGNVNVIFTKIRLVWSDFPSDTNRRVPVYLYGGPTAYQQTYIGDFDQIGSAGEIEISGSWPHFLPYGAGGVLYGEGTPIKCKIILSEDMQGTPADNSLHDLGSTVPFDYTAPVGKAFAGYQIGARPQEAFNPPVQNISGNIVIGPSETEIFILFIMQDYVPPAESCDSISNSIEVGLGTDTGEYSLGVLQGNLGERSGSVAAGGFVLSTQQKVEEIALRAVGSTALRAGSAVLSIIRAGAVIGGGVLAVQAGQQIARWIMPTPIIPKVGDDLTVTFEPGTFPDTCPTSPPGPLDPLKTDYPVDEEKTSPKPVPDAPINPHIPTAPPVLTDPCCAAVCDQLHQIVQQLHAQQMTQEWVGNVIDQRLSEIVEIRGDIQDANAWLERIAKGVYHIRPGTAEEYPLAEEILGLLDGLNIYLR